jgi:hypothetical protein
MELDGLCLLGALLAIAAWSPVLSDETRSHPTLTPHGALRLPAVDVEAYNIELKDDEGFVGDRANKGAFRRFIANGANRSTRLAKIHSGIFRATP